VQMGRKERNGHHAVAVGCCILGEREKCPSHHLYTPLRHRSDQPRILWCRWAGREETVSMPSWWAAAFSAKVRNVLHTTFTPLFTPIRSAEDPMVQNGPAGKKQSSCHRGGLLHSRRKREMFFTPPSHHSEAPIRSAKDLMVQMGGKKENGHHAVAAGCRILGERGNVLHTTFTPI
jgi:hypothetical protein